jgi:arylsulfatase A-like enzyme
MDGKQDRLKLAGFARHWTSALAALLSLAFLAVSPVVGAASSKPNIIFVLADDLGYGDVGVFFQNSRREKKDWAEPWHLTPNLDRMAAEGVQLRHHYCSAPVCAPSRASLLLGAHQGHANVRDNQFDKALENNHTLGTLMKAAGYATAAIGKWGLQGQGNSPETWPAYPTKRGFDLFFGYVRHKDGHAHYPKEDRKELWENEREISAGLDRCYTTDLFTARAKKWIADQRRERPEQPFFLYLAYDTPHAKLQLPPCAYPAGGGAKGGVQWLGKPGQMINTAAGAVDAYIHPDYEGARWDDDRDAATPDQPWPDVYKRYATDVRRIDDSVGDLLALLKDLAIERETLVVFTSDNGPSKESYLPEHFEPHFFNSFGPMDGIKRDLWEGGIRMGALAHWPGRIPPNRVNDSPSMFHDWLATFAELAEVPAPARTDGVSLVPALTGRGVQKPSIGYVEYFEGSKTPAYHEFEPVRRGHERKQMQAIRLGELMGVRYGIQSHADPFEIYNVVTDPKQTQNLAPKQPQLEARMRDAVLRLRRPSPAAKRPYDNEPVPPLTPVRTASGVEMRTFAQGTLWLARLEDLTPVATRSVSFPSVLNHNGDGVQTDVLFTGYIEAPADGDYTFALPTRSTALLRIHDATVIDAGFAQASAEASGTIKLKAGKHPFRLYWRSGAAPPSLEWSSATIAKQAVPESAFFRDQPAPSHGGEKL